MNLRNCFKTPFPLRKQY